MPAMAGQGKGKLMKVFVAGATGRVGRDLVQDLTSAGHEVVAGSRHPEVELPGATFREIDFHWEVPQMADAIRGCDAVYFTAGSRGKDLLQVDAFGAVKLMQACEQMGIKRFIMLSSMFAMEPERWAQEEALKSITNYNIAKFFADEWLVSRTNLDYTIVQASILTEEPGTGHIEVGPSHEETNPIPDVAQVLADVLERRNTIGKVIMIGSGPTPIPEALDAV